MKQLVLPRVPVRRSSLRSARDAVFGGEMLRRVHGPSLTFQTAPEPHHKRSFRFTVGVGEVPLPIRRFFCGDRLRVTTTQSLRESPTRIEVANHLKLHFVGAEFFKLRPTFWLEETPEGIVLGGQVRHTALLPPPLKGIAEAFMMHGSAQQLKVFGASLAEAGVIEYSEA